MWNELFYFCRRSSSFRRIGRWLWSSWPRWRTPSQPWSSFTTTSWARPATSESHSRNRQSEQQKVKLEESIKLIQKKRNYFTQKTKKVLLLQKRKNEALFTATPLNNILLILYEEKNRVKRKVLRPKHKFNQSPASHFSVSYVLSLVELLLWWWPAGRQAFPFLSNLP